MPALMWLAATLVIFGAVMLIFGQGAAVIWFGAIAAGCALFVVETTHTGHKA